MKNPWILDIKELRFPKSQVYSLKMSQNWFMWWKPWISLISFWTLKLETNCLINFNFSASSDTNRTSVDVIFDDFSKCDKKLKRNVEVQCLFSLHRPPRQSTTYLNILGSPSALSGYKSFFSELFFSSLYMGQVSRTLVEGIAVLKMLKTTDLQRCSYLLSFDAEQNQKFKIRRFSARRNRVPGRADSPTTVTVVARWHFYCLKNCWYLSRLWKIPAVWMTC